jgi:hypothetical protein
MRVESFFTEIKILTAQSGTRRPRLEHTITRRDTDFVLSTSAFNARERRWNLGECGLEADEQEEAAYGEG